MDRIKSHAFRREDWEDTAGDRFFAFADSLRIPEPTRPAPQFAPVAIDDVLAGREEDVPVTITTQDLIENDIRAPGQPLTIIAVGNAQHCTVTLHADGTMTLVPDADFFGDASFRYTLLGDGETSQANVIVHVKSVPDMPDALSLDHDVVAEDHNGVVGTLSAHDVDSTQFTYIVQSGGRGRFKTTAIDAGTARLEVVEGAHFDYVTEPVVEVMIRVTDETGWNYDRTFSINVKPSAVFTERADEVDFNALTPFEANVVAQMDPGKADLLLTQALGGDDIVTLPNKTHYFLADHIRWNPANIFKAGAGNDIVAGGDGYDRIDGGADDDRILGSNGLDELWGGDGNDIFEYSNIAISTMSAGSFQSIDGGANDASKADVIVLPGHPSDYVITPQFPAAAGAALHTIIAFGNGRTIDAVNVEQVRFTGGTSNVVTSGNMLLEMDKLANEVYGPQPTFSHVAELFPTQDAPYKQTLGVTDAAETRGWHALQAIELGMAVAGTFGPTRYAMANGHYQAINPAQQFRGDTPEANAIVLTGVVDGKVTLAIAFRGTDQAADFIDYFDFTTQHYAKFAPLINAIDAYVADSRNGIQQVLVTGHSLGGGMVQEFLAAHPDTGVTYRALTVGSPGSDDSHINAGDTRLVNFVHIDDFVGMIAPGLSSASDAQKFALISFVKQYVGLDLSTLLADMQGKARNGRTVFIDSDVSDSAIFNPVAEHDRNLYRNSLQTLLIAASDDGPFSRTNLAASLRAGTIYAGEGSGKSLQIAVGEPGSSEIHSRPGDDYVYGGIGAQQIIWEWGVPASFKARIIEGGHDSAHSIDSLKLPGFKSLWGTDAKGDHYDLTFGGVKVGELWGVEKLVFTLFRDTDLPGAAVGAQSGNDAVPVVYLDGSAPTVQQAGPGDTVLTAIAGVDYITTGSNDLTVTGSAADDYFVLGGGHQNISAGAGNDIVDAGLAAAGAVFAISGGGGNDTLVSGQNDVMTAKFSGGVADYGVTENADGSITITDLRDGSPDGSDSLFGVDFISFSTDWLTFATSDYLAAYSILTLLGTSASETLSTHIDRKILAYGLGGDDSILGGVRDDSLSGGAGADQLDGGAGADILDGGSGNDHLAGGTGNDTYLVDSIGDVVVENRDDGSDRVLAMASFALSAGAEIERLTTIDNLATTAINLTGNTLSQFIYGNAGSNILDGGGGGDVLIGLDGDDIYYIRNVADRVLEASGGGNDRVFAAASFTLEAGSEVEKFTTVDNLATTAINLTGNGLAQYIYGNAGANILDGGGGADVLVGLGGDDIYYIRNVADRAVEAAGGGNDRVFAASSFILETGSDVEKFTTVDNLATNSINLTGNAFSQFIYGNAGSNILDGGGGGDVLVGLGGDDFYYIRNVADRVVEAAGGGNDRVFAAANFTLEVDSDVEKFTTVDNLATTAINLTGNALAQYLYGNAGSNTLDGGGGGDVMVGLGGDDFYYIRNVADRVVEAAGGGNDRVFAAASFTLEAGSEVEKFTTVDNLATAALNLTGNGLVQYIYGNAGVNILDGGGGGDVLVGLGGDDIYYVRNVADRVVEAAGGGNDRVFAAASFMLEAGSEVEKFTTIDSLATTAINLAGNELSQYLYGNAGANLLDGKGGADVMTGFGGSDTFAFTTLLGAGNVDRITDLASGVDKIALDALIFVGLTPGALSAGAFHIGSAAGDADDRIIYDHGTGALYFDNDGNGVGTAVLFAILDGAPAIGASDFAVI